MQYTPESTTQPGLRKREIAYKLRIGDILQGNPVIEEQEQPAGSAEGAGAARAVRERFRFLELGDRQIVRVNVVANVIDKFTSEGERRWATITLDDASGQIQLKVFGDDTAKFQNINQGETILAIGVLRSYNRQIYILPEIIKKIEPSYLLVRNLEVERVQAEHAKSGHLGEDTNRAYSAQAKEQEQGQAKAGAETEEQNNMPGRDLSIKEQIIHFIKAGESGENDRGVDIEQIILKLKDISPEQINSEITKLIEDGMIYEPRPGRVRWLG